MVKKHTAALLWDIDGTLLNTGRAGVFALEDAVQNVTGQKADLSALPTAGLTDTEIAAALLRQAGLEPEKALVRRLLDAYESHLPASLPKRQGHVLPGVRAILENVARRDDMISLLLTGNTRAGGRAKLVHYGLDRFFSEGAFSDDHLDRPSIARRALELVRDLEKELSLDRVFVIGDTPHDIRCGKAIGARTIAVATGGYPETELKSHGPWWVVPELPPAGIFLEKVLGANALDGPL